MLKLEKRHIPLELIAPHIPNNPITVEAGAHIGRGTKKMSQFWPNGTIHAFEPIPELFIRLQEYTHGCNNIVYYNYALSNTTESTTMHASGGRCTSVSSLLEPHTFKTEKPDVTFDTIQVQTITLDDWAHLTRSRSKNPVHFDPSIHAAPLRTQDERRDSVSRSSTPIDISSLDTFSLRENTRDGRGLNKTSHKVGVGLLWLDLQGAELLALQGAEKLLDNVKAIHVEVHLTERYKNNPLYHEIREWLEARGFHATIEAFKDPTWGNVLFVRSA